MRQPRSSTIPQTDVEVRLDGTPGVETILPQPNAAGTSTIRHECVVTIRGGEQITIAVSIQDLDTLVVIDTRVENIHRFTERFDPGPDARVNHENLQDVMWTQRGGVNFASRMKTELIGQNEQAGSFRRAHQTALIEVDLYFLSTVPFTGPMRKLAGQSWLNDGQYLRSAPFERGILPDAVACAGLATHRIVFEEHRQLNRGERVHATRQRAVERPSEGPAVTFAFHLRLAAPVLPPSLPNFGMALPNHSVFGVGIPTALVAPPLPPHPTVPVTAPPQALATGIAPPPSLIQPPGSTPAPVTAPIPPPHMVQATAPLQASAFGIPPPSFTTQAAGTAPAPVTTSLASTAALPTTGHPILNQFGKLPRDTTGDDYGGSPAHPSQVNNRPQTDSAVRRSSTIVVGDVGGDGGHLWVLERVPAAEDSDGEFGREPEPEFASSSSESEEDE